MAVSFEELRSIMVENQIKARGVKDPRVLGAMLKVPRHEFVPEDFKTAAYEDHPLPLAENQTISQPYIVAAMTELLELKGTEKLLEVGTGSGYQAAVLAELCKEVYTIDIHPALAQSAEKLLKNLGYANISVKSGDGYYGWAEHSPFDGIIVACAPYNIPKALFEQLKEGGKLVIPVGEVLQELVVVTKKDGKPESRGVMTVRFVPMLREER